MNEPPTHLSHSSRETLLRCAKAYFLSRIAKAPSRPALWLAGGSAVHEVTELWDREQVADLEATWSIHFDRQLKEMRDKEPNENAWRWSKTEPIETWRSIGLQFVQTYVSWRERAQWEIWTTPEGEPAIELDVSGLLPGCPVEIKGYVDRVFHDPVFDKLWVLDLKSGKRPPKSADQFATYAALIEVKYGVKITDGVAFMNRQGTLGKPFNLSEHTPESIGKVYGEAWELIETGEFPANGFDRECFICDVSAACYAKRGPLAAQYDPNHPDHPDHQYPF
ncbi:RecB family exonuclease [Streptomyces halobius]|uniref:PD-(D/E)XK nuclease family protein n=1 Tax=Streptomyces halobius TaxID=2879846 RepID=A0ABY4M1I2_9ACTN|nr:PD-(D/E)XK nuclease family protein [Streptomyces halobius]UQA91610.1 PD-(D/E)XK nuclease family protein [Streptomyces halobius]